MAQGKEINIRLHLLLALGSREMLWDYIDELYEENKWEYYKAYINGGFKEDISKTRFSAQTEEHIIKVMAFNTWCENNNDYTLIYSIIKKGYKRVWNYFKKSQSGGIVDIDSYILSKFQKNNVDEMSEIDIYNELFVLLFLCHNNNIDFMMGNTQAMVIEYCGKFEMDAFARELREHSMNNSSDKEELKERISGIYQDLSINEKFLKVDKSINLLLDKVIMEDEKKLYFEMHGKQLVHNGEMDLTTDEYYEFRHNVFHHSYSKYIGIYSQMVKMMGLNEELFDRVKLSKKEMDFIIAHYEISKEVNSLDESQKENTIISLLFIYAFSLLYKELKKSYLEDAKDEEYKELEKLRTTLEQKHKEVKEQMETNKLKELDTQRRVESLEEENDQLKLENKRLKEQLQDQEDNSKELIAMREFLYNQSNSDYIEETTNSVNKEELINSKKIAVFGGHPIWHSKLKEKFPNVILVAPERVNIDFSFVDNLDCVFVHSSYCNHSMYRKLMSALRNNDCSLGYTSGVNMNITINEIYDCLTKK